MNAEKKGGRNEEPVILLICGRSPPKDRYKATVCSPTVDLLESYVVACAHGAHVISRATKGSGPKGSTLPIWLAALPREAQHKNYFGVR